MRLELSPDDLLTTTRAVRKRLDLTRPVPREVIEECIEIALQAPTGSNQQGWHWVIVTEPEAKMKIADWYGEVFDVYAQQSAAAAARAMLPPDDTRVSRAEAVRSSATYLRRHMHEVPVLVIPCHWGRPGESGGSSQAGFWGSIFPAVWSFQLALRARGLGTALTTLHLPHEADVADLLGIPDDRVVQACLLPVAYTKGIDFKPAPRNPAASVIHWERW